MAINEKLLIPDTAIEPSFNTVLYTGDGDTTAQPVTGVGFTPDLVWIKTRNQAVRHILTDSVRGVDSQIFSNETFSESNYGEFNTFDSDGFTVKRNTGTDYLNQSGINYVAWCFNAGGNEVTNTDGDHNSTVRANNNLGFSIVKGSGSGTGVQTVGHGLDSAPEMILIKNIAVSDNWWVYHSQTGVSKYLQLNTNSTPANWADNMVVNSTQIGVRQDSTGSWGNLIAYCFTSKTGVSKVGTYLGTGTSGNVITTGFEPAFVMIKNTDDTGSWLILDNVRDTDGVLNEHLYANLSNAEATASTATITPNINGFTIGNSNSIHLNRSGDDFIYYAIADI